MIATVFELLIQIIVHSRTGKPDSSKVFKPKGGSNKLGMPVEVAVRDAVTVGEGVAVGVLVAVAEGVFVGVAVGVSVCVADGVAVGVSVEVPVGVLVGVAVGVSVGVAEGVAVGVSVGIFVAVGVFVGVNTVSVAVEVLPVPPFVDVTVTLLSLIPSVEPSTSTENVQVAPAASVAPDRLTVDEPDVAVIVPPPQLPVCPFGVATMRPMGNVSVKATPVKAVSESELVIVKLNEVASFKRILAAPNDLLIDGGSITTSVSVAGSLLVAPWLLIRAPAGIVFR